MAHLDLALAFIGALAFAAFLIRSRHTTTPSPTGDDLTPRITALESKVATLELANVIRPKPKAVP